MDDKTMRIIKREKLSKEAISVVTRILEEWESKAIGFWPRSDSNPKDCARAASILGRTCEDKEAIRFFVPVCPDYPDSITGQLGTGILKLNIPLIDISKIIVNSLLKEKIRFELNFILADTETDIGEIIQRLAGSEKDFLTRCQLSIESFRMKLPVQAKVSTFSDFFQGKWHEMQYFWEEIIKEAMGQHDNLDYFLKDLARHRTEKFVCQFGRRLNFDECVKMAIRHYAQYMTLGHWMHQYSRSILINTDSPNLSAIRKPLVPKSLPGFLPKIKDTWQRVPIIVPLSP